MKIEFTTDNKLTELDFKPIPSKKFIPEWYKNMSLHTEGADSFDAKKLVADGSKTTFTIKGCIPVLDYITSGYILIAHADILITPEISEDKESKTYWWRSNTADIESHNHSQCPIKMNGYKNNYFKIVNPWSIKTPKGYSCLFYQPEYFMETRYKLLPAIVDTDGYSEPVNFPGIILSNESFMIKAGDPIMAVFPFKRDNWESEIRLKTEEEMKQPNRILAYLERGYKNLFHNKKSYD